MHEAEYTAVKTCRKCGKTKSVEDFYRKSSSKDGKRSQCKVCTLACTDKHRQAERAKIRYAAKRDQIIAYQKKYRDKNAEKVRLDARERYWKNRESRIQTMRRYAKIMAPFIADMRRKDRAENPTKYRALDQKRRAARKNAPGCHTKADIDFLIMAQKNCCAVCRSRLRGFHVDHVIPIARGGSNSKDNLQILCPACNMSKGSKHPVEFMQSRGFLI